jgi:ubiquinone/menaquinone biosynthesis C-methylase UbiE
VTAPDPHGERPTGPAAGDPGVATKRLVARTFDAAAAAYAEERALRWGDLGQRLVQLAEVGPGMRVLDVGTGTGAALLPAARAVGPTGVAVGIDLSRGMLQQARAAVAAAGLRNVRLAVGDAEAPEVGTERVDRVLAAHVLFFLADLDRALAAYARILKPGGRLAVSSWGPDDPAWHRVREPVRAAAGDVGALLLPSAAAFAGDEALTSALERHGFVDVRHVTEPVAARYADAVAWLAFTRASGSRAWWDAVPPERLAEVEAAVLERVAELREPDGSVVVRAAVRFTVATRPVLVT